MTSFVTIYGQFKIALDTLERQGTEGQEIREAAERAGWSADAHHLLSELVALPCPASDGVSEHALPFPWTEPASQHAAARAAEAQLIVFDLHGGSDRGDLQLRLSGHVARPDGQPLYLFGAVPTPLVTRVVRDLRNELRPASALAVLAYRLVPLAEEVRTLELSSAYSPRKRMIQRVKTIQVYDHRLKRKGDQVIHEATLRARHDADSPKRNHHASTLGSSVLEGLVLHALSAPARDFFGEAGSAERPSNPAPTDQARSLYTLLRPKAPEDSSTTTSRKKGKKPPAAPTPAPAPPLPVIPDPPAPEPEVAAPVPLPAEAPAPACDSWSGLPRHMAVDDEVVRQARAALARARPLLLRGAPGTGKTMLATALAEILCGQGNFTLVTADARWTSADVVGGLRVAAGSGLQYAFAPGVVTRAAARHVQSLRETGRPHALIIDEFNRANQDEAFGRLLTLLDPPYRAMMPLVDAQDGAPESVYLPPDFLLIATMNDADTARLHELGAALSRRFVSVQVDVPRSERAFLQTGLTEPHLPTLDALLDFVGTGERADDLEGGRLRAHVPVGTAFLREALAMVGQELSVDEALTTLTPPLLAHLGRDALSALYTSATRGGLTAMGRHLEGALARTHF